MPAEGFFQRWSRLKTEPAPAESVAGDKPPGPQFPAAAAPAPAANPGQPAQPAREESAPVRRPTQDDVALLDADSDYSAFVARGVDQSVRRSALKKLFSDPHFNTGDGLDLYMGDYNKPDPISAAMMGALRHTQSFFAQAYPDENAGDGGKEGDGARAGTAAMDKGAASAAALSSPEPQVAGTSETAGNGIATIATSTITEDKA